MVGPQVALAQRLINFSLSLLRHPGWSAELGIGEASSDWLSPSRSHYGRSFSTTNHWPGEQGGIISVGQAWTKLTQRLRLL